MKTMQSLRAKTFVTGDGGGQTPLMFVKALSNQTPLGSPKNSVTPGIRSLSKRSAQNPNNFQCQCHSIALERVHCTPRRSA